MVLHFTPTETTQAYMEALNTHLEQHGGPVSLYSDKHSIFRVRAAFLFFDSDHPNTRLEDLSKITAKYHHSFLTFR